MKVAINGAGVAGPALAYWLHRGGHEVVLIEKAPEFRTGGYIIDFWGVGYTVAERMGILPAVKQAGYLVRELRIVDEHGNRVGGFDASIFHRLADGRFTSVARGDLAKAIYSTIEGRVETMFSNSIAALEESDDYIRVSFERGSPRDFDLVVGADGLHSTVRELAFGPESRFERRLGYGVAAVEVEGYQPRDELVYVAYAMPGRQVARFALRDDRTLFLFIFVDEEVEGAKPHDVAGRKRLLHRVFGDGGWECSRILEAVDQVHDVYFDNVSQIRMDAWSKGRVVLVGDAAACASLLAGEGAGLGLTEAYVLAGELFRAPGDHPEAFRRYEERLRGFVEGKQKSAKGFASTFAPKTRFGIWFRNLATRLMAADPVARVLSGGMVRDDFELPDYGM
ncbi:FAD-binding domain [Paludisphaera rhizosphaerae]|uniref:FAD-binding domain n=1 Tax=Paludisphaera rhizosphaerae TaxID=2711216 RepID=UPI0013EA8DBF|nr:FAD-binding domain [Paludisphaera rhizosphaerae]